MAVTNLPQHKPSRELSVAAIKEAHAQLDSTGQNLGKLAKPNTRSTDQRPRAGPDKPARRLLRSKILSRRLVGLLALAGIGVTALVWQPHLEAAPEPPILSMLDANRDASPPIPGVSNKSDIAANASKPSELVAQAAPQNATVASAPSPASVELGQKMGDIVRELAGVKQNLDQLKAEQSRVSRENAELAEQLKATRELARHSGELIEELKAMQGETGHEISRLADHLKASQDLMVTVTGQLKESQERAARLLESEQKQRAARKPVVTVPKPASSTAVTQAQNPRNLRPSQQ